jgi:DNA polymerase III sliding clamp (beta) subunit (PCNA family)
MFQFTLLYPEAIKIAKKLAHSVSKEETRYYLNGFFMHKAEDGRHFAASTNGHIMTRLEVNPEYDTSQEFPAAIFPTAAIKQLESFRPSVSVRARMTVTFHVDADNHVYQIECDGQSFGGQLINANYPDYTRVIPAGWESFTNEYGNCGFSPVYLAAIFKAASHSAKDFKPIASSVRMFFSADRPCVIQEAKDPSVLYLIMPIRSSLEEHRHAAQVSEVTPETVAPAAADEAGRAA